MPNVFGNPSGEPDKGRGTFSVASSGGKPEVVSAESLPRKSLSAKNYRTRFVNSSIATINGWRASTDVDILFMARLARRR
jgi:hypothetical protein